ncbi:hypothetical protein, partial [Helicobacter sp.]|uniref:hypothetical protein n=1 Tax=Helicobacter sp. TaxID=218 RepID=UPI0037515E80|nr:hypothetical protein [Helicobacter sp.]
CLSYIIWWLIYRKLFKSQKHISKFLVVLGSIGLIMFYYTPYSYYLEPSFYEFKEMCKLNELPNTEEKYNKILGYFDLSLDTLDWEELNGRVEKLKQTNGWYKKNIFEYRTATDWKYKNSRIEMAILFFSNESKINRHNINFMYFSSVWHTRRYYLSGNEGTGIYWSEETLGCGDIVKENEE